MNTHPALRAGYARADRKSNTREAIAAKLVANLLTESGIHRLICLDLHSGQARTRRRLPSRLFWRPVLRFHYSMSVQSLLRGFIRPLRRCEPVRARRVLAHCARGILHCSLCASSNLCCAIAALLCCVPAARGVLRPPCCAHPRRRQAQRVRHSHPPGASPPHCLRSSQRAPSTHITNNQSSSSPTSDGVGCVLRVLSRGADTWRRRSRHRTSSLSRRTSAASPVPARSPRRSATPRSLLSTSAARATTRLRRAAAEGTKPAGNKPIQQFTCRTPLLCGSDTESLMNVSGFPLSLR